MTLEEKERNTGNGIMERDLNYFRSDDVKKAVLDIIELEKYYMNCNKHLDEKFENYFKKKYELDIRNNDSLDCHKRILGSFK